MREFEANEISETEINLTDEADLSEVYKLIEDEENFILKCGNKSEVIIGNNILPKIKNGDIKITAENVKMEER